MRIPVIALAAIFCFAAYVAASSWSTMHRRDEVRSAIEQFRQSDSDLRQAAISIRYGHSFSMDQLRRASNDMTRHGERLTVLSADAPEFADVHERIHDYAQDAVALANDVASLSAGLRNSIRGALDARARIRNAQCLDPGSSQDDDAEELVSLAVHYSLQPGIASVTRLQSLQLKLASNPPSDKQCSRLWQAMLGHATVLQNEQPQMAEKLRELLAGQHHQIHDKLDLGLGLVTRRVDQAALSKGAVWMILLIASISWVAPTSTQITRQSLQLQDALKDADDKARLANAARLAKNDFLANMSHELRTPLHGVHGMIEALGESGVTREQAELLNTMQRSANDLLSTVGDILSFSAIESNKMKIETAPFDLRLVLERLMESGRSGAQGKKITFRLDTEHISQPYFVGDAKRIQQVLLSLVGNALKFTAAGRVDVRAYTAPGKEGLNNKREQQLRIEVADTGIGIAEDKLDRIFEHFSQADNSTTRAYGGAGLGLTVSRKLAQLMGGVITVRSVLGTGSTFCLALTLPVPENTPHPSLLPAPPSPALSQTLTVLFAEDNLVNQKIGNRILSKMGYEVTLCCNGEEALRAYESAHFDIILMDCQMPCMDGYACTEAIRALECESGRRTPIIAVTANAMKGDDEKCFQAGMDDYLAKPYKAADLTKVLRKWGG